MYPLGLLFLFVTIQFINKAFFLSFRHVQFVWMILGTRRKLVFVDVGMLITTSRSSRCLFLLFFYLGEKQYGSSLTTSLPLARAACL